MHLTSAVNDRTASTVTRSTRHRRRAVIATGAVLIAAAAGVAPVASAQGGPPGEIRYGATITLRHDATGCRLHSHAFTYGHSGSSRQQQVTCFAESDDNDVWRVKAPHGEADDARAGQPVQGGDIIRLEHTITRRNLHSHPGIPSPVSRQQEVTGFGTRGAGDSNDDWRVELQDGTTWRAGTHLRLVHVATGRALHSHAGFSDVKWTRGQQEVTAFADRDPNDLWSAAPIDAPLLWRSVVAYMTQEIVTNARGPEVAKIRELLARRVTRPVALAAWYRLVRPDGPWDHKPKLRDAFGMSLDDDDSRMIDMPDSPWRVSYELWSNLHYGYVGRVAGFDERTLQAGHQVAGLAGRSDAFDVAAVQLGLDLYAAYSDPSTLTAETVDEFVRSHVDALMVGTRHVLPRK